MWWCDRCLLQLFPKLMGDANFDWHSRFRWGFGIFRINLRHSLTMIMCGQFSHKISYRRLFVTGPFMEQFVRGVPDRNISWNRVTRIYLFYGFTGKQWQTFVIFWLRRTERQNFALLWLYEAERTWSTRTEQDNKLSFDHISPCGSIPGGQTTSVN